ncbi:TolC family protein [Pontibacter cellulosilyticus]|uniref:TolC family protein n=1 Tax=Pontibacter cellulosilyticus TaxID=1720253 RepID=A0A923SK83_9BACT|nr:TolC family protein [Pontibacter cellulosilyticus]MBC5994477.1 TolC family protein [Pontibacter cellulosilyticus]
MNRFLLAVLYFLIIPQLCFTAPAKDLPKAKLLTLDAVIELAKEQSPKFRYAEVLFENKQWQYKTYRSNFLPQLNLNGVLPEYNKTIEPRLTDKGSLIFINTHNASSSMQLSLGQEIWPTGGYISINSNLKRIDDFQADINRTRYSSVPATITLTQPIFGFNNRAWDRKISPLRYEEAKRDYREEMEEIAKEATNHFFNLLLSQISYQIAERNIAINDTLYKVAEKKFEDGKIPENELLQMELALLNSEQNLDQAKLDVEANTLKLKVFLGVTDNYPIELAAPSDIPQFEVDEEIALEQASHNRQRVIGFKRELLEAEMRLAKAKGETGFSANLFASFGLTQQSLEVQEAYNDPSQQQRVRLGFNIPVMDWGRAEAILGTAKANHTLTKANIELQQNSFEQEVYLQVKRFKVLRKQMEGAKRADEIAKKRYQITLSRYLDNKIGLIDLNIATEERDKASRSYVTSLRNFWVAYYTLRSLTLYDFETNQPLALPAG